MTFRLGIFLGGAIALASCHGPEPLPELRGGVEIALRRGVSWSTLKVRPPYIIGPRSNLRLGRGVLSGSIDGHGVHITIEKNSATGTGPSGPVAIDIEDEPDALVFAGTWNGSRVNFRVTADAMKGTIPIYSGRTMASVASCQYVLDRIESDGSRAGISICNGLPEDTLLEVPAAIRTWLTRSELVVVLLALLSAPPYTIMEMN